MIRFFTRLLIGLVGLALIVLVALRLFAAWRETETGVQPVEGRMIETALGRVYVEEAGALDAPAILLIHGSVGWARLWHPTQDVLAKAGYRAIAFDMPPMGFSDRDPASNYGRDQQSRRILALTDALGVRPIIVAHSFGAGPGAEAVMQNPGAFAGLVVISGAIGLGSHEAPRVLPMPLRPVIVRELLVSASATNLWATAPLLKLFLYRKDVVTPEVIALLQRPARQVGSTREIARWLPTLLVPPLDAQSTRDAGWQALTLPVAFIWGDRDTTTPLVQGQALAALTNAPLAVLRDVGHIPQLEAPDDFHRALLDTLRVMTP